MKCPNCHEPHMIKSIEIDISEDWEMARCGRCKTRFTVYYDNETQDERAERLKRREIKRMKKELLAKGHREEAIS